MFIHKKNFLTEDAINQLLGFVKTLDRHWFKATYKGYPYKYEMANSGDYAWFTDPYRYEKNTNGLVIPDFVKMLAKEYGIRAETMLINKYVPRLNDGKMHLGLHQDKDEQARTPIMSLSVGCSANFITAQSYNGPKTTHIISNGDLLVFGDKNRLIWHGVQNVIKDHPLSIRYNFTVRQVSV